MYHRVVSFMFCCLLLTGSLVCTSFLSAAEKESTKPFTIVTFGDSTTAMRGPLVVVFDDS